MTNANSNKNEDMVVEFQYLGNCVDAFDEDGESLIESFRDTSDFACVEHESKEINKNQFLKFIGDKQNLKSFEDILSKPSCMFLYNEYRHVLFIYDDETDIHYFFQGKETPKLTKTSNLKYKP